MQSSQSPEPSSGEYERSPSPVADHVTDKFTITPHDSIILKGYLQDFQKGDTESRKKILERAIGELYALRPPNPAFNKKEARNVFIVLYTTISITDHLFLS
jgi:hypothetical protein